MHEDETRQSTSARETRAASHEATLIPWRGVNRPIAPRAHADIAGLGNASKLEGSARPFPVHTRLKILFCGISRSGGTVVAVVSCFLGIPLYYYR